MEFDIIIVTRNRKELLQISIPLMLRQSRLPSQLIIVDSSDFHSEVKSTVEKIIESIDVKIDLKIIHSNPGIQYQRNIGLKYAISPVVFFPDDDSLWFPGVAEYVMKIYEKDNENCIGAVSASESKTPPEEAFLNIKKLYNIQMRDRINSEIHQYIQKIEKIFFPDPCFIFNHLDRHKVKIPNWIEEVDSILTGPMTGFLMSFRKNLIKNVGFDEILGQYGLFEDREASFAILRSHIILRATKAKVFHYRFPTNRTDGRIFGLMHILNNAYIVCKYSDLNSIERKKIKRFAYYKLLRYLLQSYTKYGRLRLKGAWTASSGISQLIDTPPNEVASLYENLRKLYLKGLGISDN